MLACLAPYLNTSTHWYAALLALVFPVILFALLCFVFLWLILKDKFWIVSLVILLAGYKQITNTFAFNLPSDFEQIKGANTLRVVQWNVSNWDHQDEDDLSYRKEMFELLKTENADILCFEEFFEPLGKKRKLSNIQQLIKMGYPFYYFVPSGTKQRSYASGIAIFSRYPISDTLYYPFKETEDGENLLQADVHVNGKTFRVFATHLQSVRFQDKDYESIDRLKKVKKTNPKVYKQVASKLKSGYELRYRQTKIVSEQVKESPYPAIVFGDFNDVPSSSTYYKIKGRLQDTFLKKGTFIGRTFRFISPTLRIDYILADTSFKVKQFKRLLVPYSDHYGLVADLEM